ncbi:MAG: DUF697 domain-containing protein [Myxococcota bacterium]
MGELSETLDQLAQVFDRLPFVGRVKKDVDQLRRLLHARRPCRVVAAGPAADQIATKLCGACATLYAVRDAVTAADRGGADSDQDRRNSTGQHTQVGIDAGTEEPSWEKKTCGAGRVDWLAISPRAGRDALIRAVSVATPDLVVWSGTRDEFAASADALYGQLDCFSEGRSGRLLVCVLLLEGPSAASSVPRREFPEIERFLKHAAFERHQDAGRVFWLEQGEPGLTSGASDWAAVADWIVDALPTEAKVEAARLFIEARQARRRVAGQLIHACSTLAVTVALTPIPLSDLAVLAPLQVTMISALAHLSGREIGTKTAKEWMGRLGFVGGAGFGFRFTAQQLVKFVPGVGSLISAGVAGAGTVALGRAAMRCFKL